MDLHTPNLEAATLDWQGQGTSSLFFLPGNMETADAQLTAEGRWLFRCRVADHVGAGMEVRLVAASSFAGMLRTYFVNLWYCSSRCHDACCGGASFRCFLLQHNTKQQQGVCVLLFRPCS